ncbi:MAG: PKD domain-containing protein, partial [Syntrophobacterales bacterium]
VTVTDFGGLKDSDTTIVNLTGENDPPTADAGPDQNVDEGTTVILSGSNSFDPDDGIESYLWKQILGPPVSLSDPEAVQPTFFAPEVGPDGFSYTFELTVTDFGGLQASDTAIVNVIWLNDPPTANAGVDQTVLEQSTVNMDGSKSSDPDEGIESYLWKQAAGQSVTFSDPTSAQPTFEAPSFDKSGDQPLIFELIVTDNGGLQSSDSTNVSVSNYEKDNPGASGGGCFIDTGAYGSRMAQ